MNWCITEKRKSFVISNTKSYRYCTKNMNHYTKSYTLTANRSCRVGSCCVWLKSSITWSSPTNGQNINPRTDRTWSENVQTKGLFAHDVIIEVAAPRGGRVALIFFRSVRDPWQTPSNERCVVNSLCSHFGFQFSTSRLFFFIFVRTTAVLSSLLPDIDLCQDSDASYYLMLSRIDLLSWDIQRNHPCSYVCNPGAKGLKSARLSKLQPFLCFDTASWDSSTLQLSCGYQKVTYCFLVATTYNTQQEMTSVTTTVCIRFSKELNRCRRLILFEWSFNCLVYWSVLPWVVTILANDKIYSYLLFVRCHVGCYSCLRHKKMDIFKSLKTSLSQWLLSLFYLRSLFWIDWFANCHLLCFSI